MATQNISNVELQKSIRNLESKLQRQAEAVQTTQALIDALKRIQAGIPATR